MPVHSAALGRRAEVTADVDTRWVLAYAAGLGFEPALCLDDAQPGGPAVPPSFCVGLEWMLSGDASRASTLGITADERIRGVHAFQDSVFHRPFRAGTRVNVASEIRYMRRTRAGTLLATLLTSHDADSGELLCESWSGSILRDVACDAEEVGTPPPYLTAPPPAPPADAARTTVPTEYGLPHTYTECARIWNPIHTERAVALRAGLPDIILHGTATWGLAGREVIRAHAGGDVRRLKRLAGRFRAPVMAGGTLVVRHAVMPDGAIAFEVETDGGALAMNGGLVELA
jgi:acyl dehydratase